MVFLGAKADLKKPNSKLEHKVMSVRRFSDAGFLNPRAGASRPPSRRESSCVHGEPVKPAGKERMRVAQWVARCWVQPIGKP
jgi:hypothetical protein